MQFQYVLLAVLATSLQVLAVPTAEAAAARSPPLLRAPGSPPPPPRPTARSLLTPATNADTPAEGTIAAHLIPCVATSATPSTASAPTTRSIKIHGQEAIQHRVLWYALGDVES
ncbi:hypothetical protein V494_03142 [Pseudogymnoascus sp. VKM F-4513 (FW-928)]|nr:hypothetical protein V494_03142 [Pseudogymnoascus sp. VKM F-4513 (FW-928)]